MLVLCPSGDQHQGLPVMSVTVNGWPFPPSWHLTDINQRDRAPDAPALKALVPRLVAAGQASGHPLGSGAQFGC
jgi:hypothetical protein